MQFRRLKALLAHAFECVPFYQARFKEFGIRPENITNLKEYGAKVPVLRRTVVRDHLEDMVAAKAADYQLTLNATSGSTGIPLQFYQDRQYQEIMRATWMRGNTWVDWKPGQRNVWIWGDTKDDGCFGKLQSRLKDWMYRRRVFPANAISSATLDEWVEQINCFRPRFIYAYGSALNALAKHVSDQDWALPSVEAALVTGDASGDRDRMEARLGFDVYSQYGCREVPHIASECKMHHMHIDSDVVLVEFVPIDGLDPWCKIVVTPLHAYGMPLLRYDTGDIGMPVDKDCTCDLPFPTMNLQIGRVSDCLVTSSGALVPPPMVGTRLGYVFESVRRYQVVQHTRHRLEVRVIQSTSFGPSQKERLVSELRSIFGRDVMIEVTYVDAFSENQSAKHRPFVSEVG
jgi:phenylacetate-CoA ligase